MRTSHSRRAAASGCVAVCLAILPLVGCRPRNRPPDVPDVAGPDLGYVDTVYTLECYPYDRDWDDVAIRYDWGDGDTSGWSDWAECGFAWGAEPELIEMTHSWVAPGTFLIRAQATDDRGLVSDWSEPRQMAIQAGSGVLADTPWPKFRHDNKNTGRVGGGR